ncbi:lytic polysaccharide monooxygenase [Daedalea quercina L-15889]|uniref:lytic cellulose monooxygenase (C4-dehydrogenating) n=1 Tax=Daedalea quercina L-15889 TaxID=1314783 RepID=A0A165NQ61_9APHY|nr:lytic polysaccharide monooxygenase [Daedalea quercina L-15889]
MKALFFTLIATAVTTVAAHYTLPDLIVNGTTASDWEYVRQTQNYETNDPVTDVTSQLIRCYENNTASSTSTATVSAGATVGFKANNDFYHPGYFSAYMSSASPAANSESAATGQTWFKIWQDVPTFTAGTDGQPGTLSFPLETSDQFTFQIPPSLPSGQYLIRGEQIALHAASTYGGAQFYLSCAQVNVVNGGDGSPEPLASFPGAYTGYEPGILINIYNLPSNYTGYTAPGPAVWNQ